MEKEEVVASAKMEGLHISPRFFRTGPHAPSRTWCFPPFIVAGDDLASWAGAAA
jgi:hypothetical protein